MVVKVVGKGGREIQLQTERRKTPQLSSPPSTELVSVTGVYNMVEPN
jgi:hypothetical protein